LQASVPQSGLIGVPKQEKSGASEEKGSGKDCLISVQRAQPACGNIH
jgi:hypothetical protein